MAVLGVNLVTFVCGSFRFALEAAGVRVLVANAPLEKPTVMVDLAALFHLSAGSSSQRYLMVTTGQSDLVVVVEEPVRLEWVAAQAIHPLPGLVRGLVSPQIVKGLLVDEGGMAIILDLTGLETP